MNIKTLSNKVTSVAGRRLLVVQKHSPHLLFGVGVVGVIGTAVLAARATLQLEDVLEETEAKKTAAKDLHSKEPDDYGDKEYKHDMTVLYARQIGKIAKLYAPAIGVGVLSVGALTGSHVVLSKRNFALTAAYATVEKSFSEYRARVTSELGEDKERELHYGATQGPAEKVKGEDGKTKTVKTKIAGGTSMYAKFFDNRNQNWNPQPEYNMVFLRSNQNYANDMLKSRGHVFLNDVYDMLGMDRTSAGAVVGWVKGNGDDFVDFGIWTDKSMGRVHDFITGREGALLLDFNVDGVVYDLI